MTQRSSGHFFATCVAVLGLALAVGADVVRAQEQPDVIQADRFTTTYWSQIRPDRNYLNGCVTGYRAFQFDQTGYFIFDRRIHGSWRLDQLGNLILRTRDGTRIRLIFDKQQTLMPSATIAFLKREERFQECRD
jgi:hypothetical protein